MVQPEKGIRGTLGVAAYLQVLHPVRTLAFPALPDLRGRDIASSLGRWDLFPFRVRSEGSVFWSVESAVSPAIQEVANNLACATSQRSL